MKDTIDTSSIKVEEEITTTTPVEPTVVEPVVEPVAEVKPIIKRNKDNGTTTNVLADQLNIDFKKLESEIEYFHQLVTNVFKFKFNASMLNIMTNYYHLNETKRYGFVGSLSFDNALMSKIKEDQSKGKLIEIYKILK